VAGKIQCFSTPSPASHANLVADQHWLGQHFEAVLVAPASDQDAVKLRGWGGQSQVHSRWRNRAWHKFQPELALRIRLQAEEGPHQRLVLSDFFQDVPSSQQKLLRCARDDRILGSPNVYSNARHDGGAEKVCVGRPLVSARGIDARALR
jgi:hypothetical protein